ncbi:hypothetical protein SCB49_08428 [unidentified eubacterium SCB49]|nr:hypothetical protein SCB49_08428 [unidentified eubacterium SCB49]
MNIWYVSIMANKSNSVLYIGCSNNIGERVKEHKFKVFPRSFRAKYNCDKLVYFEEHKSGAEASKRELQMKKWKREWKLNLIKEMNESGSDISMNWNLNFNKLRR